MIEAGAIGITSIASDIYGIQDAVQENETGLLHKLKNIERMKEKMITLKENSELRKKIGSATEERIIKEFSANRVTKEWVKFYKECLSSEKF